MCLFSFSFLFSLVIRSLLSLLQSRAPYFSPLPLFCLFFIARRAQHSQRSLLFVGKNVCYILIARICDDTRLQQYCATTSVDSCVANLTSRRDINLAQRRLTFMRDQTQLSTANFPTQNTEDTARCTMATPAVEPNASMSVLGWGCRRVCELTAHCR